MMVRTKPLSRAVEAFKALGHPARLNRRDPGRRGTRPPPARPRDLGNVDWAEACLEVEVGAPTAAAAVAGSLEEGDET
jgi:hypothetical protein